MRRSAGGDVVTGTLKAESMVLATQIVREMGGVPVDIVRVGDEGVERKGFLGLDLGVITSRITGRDILTFTSQLAVMSKAGIGLTTALESIADQFTNPRMADMVRALKRDIEGGRQFCQLLRAHGMVAVLGLAQGDAIHGGLRQHGLDIHDRFRRGGCRLGIVAEEFEHPADVLHVFLPGLD